MKRVRLVGRLVKLGIADERKTNVLTKTLSKLRENGVNLAELETAIRLRPSNKFSADFFIENAPSADKTVYATGKLFEKPDDTPELLEKLSEHLNYVSPKALSATIELFPYLGRDDRKNVENNLRVFLEHHSLTEAKEVAGALYAQVLRRAPISPEKTKELLSFAVRPQADFPLRLLSSEAAGVRVAIESFERKNEPGGLFSLAHQFGNKVETHPDYTPAAKRELVRRPSTLIVLARLDRKYVANPPTEYGDPSFWWRSLVNRHFTSEKTRKLLAAVHNALPHLHRLSAE
jgi:hypothetical protein